MNRAITPSDIVAGRRYKGGKAGRIRVVHSIAGAIPMWVWWHWNSSDAKDQCCHIETFVKWVTEVLP